MRRTKVLRPERSGEGSAGCSLTFANFFENASKEQKFYSGKLIYASSILRRNMANSGGSHQNGASSDARVRAA
ncbi:MAG: hypothetical protein WCC39_12065 [Telluria sp.]